jgi:porphobilinogen deaminase
MGTAVEPPSRVEMATSLIEAAAEGFEELAKAGAVVGSAALKRALSLLPKP